MAEKPIRGLEVFLAVAEQGSLRLAARALGVQPPTVSYQLKALEERLGAALFVRTTRSVALTEAGRLLLARAQPAVAALGEALDEIRGLGTARRGTLRITLPYVAYQLTIARKLAAFHAAFPEIELALSFNEAFVDIANEGFHAGVRLGEHIRDDMIAVRLSAPFREAFFAAPAYLERRGRPVVPPDLLTHNCIRYRYIASNRMAEWRFRGAEGVTTVGVTGNLIVNSTSAVVSAACDGLGIGWLFRPSVEAELRAGQLVSLLDDYAVERPGYFLYYPRANARIEILRRFVDVMKLQPRVRSPSRLAP